MDNSFSEKAPFDTNTPNGVLTAPRVPTREERRWHKRQEEKKAKKAVKFIRSDILISYLPKPKRK